MNTKLWFADYNKQYISDEQIFYSSDEIPIAKELENNYALIKEELSILWKNDGSVATLFGNYDAYDDKQFPPNSWKKLVLKVWGLNNKQLTNRFPSLFKMLKEYPNISSCCVTKLSPGSLIKTHFGETNAILRIHMGLRVPDVNAEVCGLEVKHKQIGWKNGKAFAFFDAHPHRAWNNSNEDRYVVIIDMIRPEFVKRRRYISVRIIVSILFFSLTTRFLGEKTLKKTPSVLLDLLTYILYLPIVVGAFINNRLGIIKL